MTLPSLRRVSRVTVLGMLSTSILGAVLCFLPGLDAPNYHAAFITALVGSLIAGPVGIAAAHRALRLQRNPFAAALRSGLPTALMPLVLLLLNGMRVRQCDVFSGVAFMLVASVFSMLWAALMGAAVATWRPRKRSAMPLFYLVFIVWAALDVLHIYRNPAIFAYNPFAGFFSGALYDAVIVIDGRLALYRVNNVAQILLIMAFARAAWDRTAGRLTFAALGRARPSRYVAIAVAAATAFAFWVARGQIGYEVSRADVQAELGKRLEDERIVLIYDRSIPDAEAHDLLEAHRFRLDQIEARLGKRFPRKITSYVYGTAAQKRLLMGAGQVYIAKPWLDEIHLNRVGFDHPVIRHELAHVVLGIFAPPPLRIPTSACIIPQMALVEGAAEAFEWDTGQLNPHEWSAAMREAKRAPDLRALLGPGGFYNQGSDTAYTLSGSFVAWVIDTYGMDKLETIYRDGDFAGALGVPLDDLVSAWEAYLDALVIPEDAAGLATGRFNTPAIHKRPCGLDVARLEAEAATKRQANDIDGAREALEQVVAWIPEDAMKRKPLVELAAASGDLAAARAAWAQYLAVPGNRNPVDDASVTELVADLIARLAFKNEGLAGTKAASAIEGDTPGKPADDGEVIGLAEAHKLYVSLADVAQPEDKRRNSLVKIYLSSEPRLARGLLRYLVTGNAAILESAATPLGDEPLVGYLLARREHGAGQFDKALPRLRAAVEKLALMPATGDHTWVPWVRREAARLIAHALYSKADYAAARDAFLFVAGLTPYAGDRDRYRDWAERCAWKLAHETTKAPVF